MEPIRTAVSELRLKASIETQYELLREEQVRTAEIEQRAEKARKLLEECSRLHNESIARQQHLTFTVGWMKDLLNVAVSAQAESSTQQPTESPIVDFAERTLERKARPIARLGTQHYLMFDRLRAYPGSPIYELSSASGADPRRVRTVMSADQERGYVNVAGPGFMLTPLGLDVLNRFEEYRRAEGKPLPSLNHSTFGDLDEEESEEEKAE